MWYCLLTHFLLWEFVPSVPHVRSASALHHSTACRKFLPDNVSGWRQCVVEQFSAGSCLRCAPGWTKAIGTADLICTVTSHRKWRAPQWHIPMVTKCQEEFTMESPMLTFGRLSLATAKFSACDMQQTASLSIKNALRQVQPSDVFPRTWSCCFTASLDFAFYFFNLIFSVLIIIVSTTLSQVPWWTHHQMPTTWVRPPWSLWCGSMQPLTSLWCLWLQQAHKTLQAKGAALAEAIDHKKGCFLTANNEKGKTCTVWTKL